MSESFGQWVPAISGAVLGLMLSGYLLISTRRLDARLKKARDEKAKGLGGTPER